MTPATVTLDPIGRILGFDPAAEALFGRTAADMVGRERATALLPGQVALRQLPGWFVAAARDGAWEGDALCRHADGRSLACHMRLTVTVVDGRPAGFVQQITALPDVAPERLAPPGGLGAVLARLAAVTRLPFVTASVLPVLFGLALAAWAGAAFSWAAGLLATLAVFLLHLGANTANDWYDGRSGCDAQNLDYVAPFSGGSRAVSFGLVSERGLAGIAVACFALGSAAGVGLVVGWAPALLWVGLAGAFLGFAYSAPPLRLAARRGLGEAAIFLSFGPLLTLAGFAAGGALPTWGAALAGIPAGLWTTGILWVNEIPDCAGDRAAGKWNLVAVLGRRRARVGVPVLLGLGHLAVVALAVGGALPWPALASLLALPLAAKATRIAWAHAEDDGIGGACAATVQHQLAAAALGLVGLTASLIAAGLLGG